MRMLLLSILFNMFDIDVTMKELEDMNEEIASDPFILNQLFSELDADGIQFVLQSLLQSIRSNEKSHYVRP